MHTPDKKEAHMTHRQLLARNAMYSNEQRLLLNVLVGRVQRQNLLSLYLRHLEKENVHESYKNMLTFILQEIQGKYLSQNKYVPAEEHIDVPYIMEQLRTMTHENEQRMLEYAIEYSMDTYGWEEHMKDSSFQKLLIKALSYQRMGFSTLSSTVIRKFECALTAQLRISQRILTSLCAEDRSMCFDLLIGKKKE